MNSKCKGPEVEMHLACLRSSMEAFVVGVELSEGEWVKENEAKDCLGPGSLA